MQMFFPENFQGKGIIMIDAAYVTPCLSIDQDGNIFGLLVQTKIDPIFVKYYISDDNALLDFI